MRPNKKEIKEIGYERVRIGNKKYETLGWHDKKKDKVRVMRVSDRHVMSINHPIRVYFETELEYDYTD